MIVLADGGQFCNTGILGYDSFRAGLRVDGTDLDPFCVKVDDFDGHLPAERPGRGVRGRRSATSPPRTSRPGVRRWRPYPLAVNHPLRPTATASTCRATATRRGSR